ncbi:hypothetical protein HK098_001847 [Nowakowskiella sp. JEL0407]|nr:hypothetical protein HK098_001847 [Nowakowskiella sp. JEL0407]
MGRKFSKKGKKRPADVLHDESSNNCTCSVANSSNNPVLPVKSLKKNKKCSASVLHAALDGDSNPVRCTQVASSTGEPIAHTHGDSDPALLNAASTAGGTNVTILDVKGSITATLKSVKELNTKISVKFVRIVKNRPLSELMKERVSYQPDAEFCKKVDQILHDWTLLSKNYSFVYSNDGHLLAARFKNGAGLGIEEEKLLEQANKRLFNLCSQGVFHKCFWGAYNKNNQIMTSANHHDKGTENYRRIQQYNKAVQPVMEALNAYLDYFISDIATEMKDRKAEHMKNDVQFASDFAHFTSHYSSEAILINRTSPCHLDLHDWDDGFCMVVNTGEFEGGNIFIYELQLQIDAPPGSIVLLKSSLLRHGSTSWTGKFRFTNVYFCREETMRTRIDPEKVKESGLSWKKKIKNVFEHSVKDIDLSKVFLDDQPIEVPLEAEFDYFPEETNRPKEEFFQVELDNRKKERKTAALKRKLEKQLEELRKKSEQATT